VSKNSVFPQPSKIGIVRSDLAAPGGIERYTLNLINKLASRGFETHVFTARPPQVLPDSSVLHRFRLPFRRPRVPRLWRQMAFNRWVRAEVKRTPLDLLFTLETWPSDVFRAGNGVHKEWLSICAQNAGLWQRLNLALQPFHRYTLSTEAAIFNPRHTRLVICNSQMVADEVTRHYPYPHEQIRVIPNGVDLEYFCPASTAHREHLRAAHKIEADDFVLLFVGSGFWRKGLDIAIDIVADLQQLKPQRSLKLFVVGKGDIEAHRRQAAQRGIGQSVFFEGTKSPDQVLEWYQLADVFLFPTRYDPFSNVCLEAAACGLPVITTPRNGFSEQVQEGINGMILRSEWNSKNRVEQVERFCGNLPPAEQVRQSIMHLSLENHIDVVFRTLEGMRR